MPRIWLLPLGNAMPMWPLLFLALSPQQAAIRALGEADLRVATVGDRLARGGAALCPGQATSLGGLVIQDARQYNGSTRADAVAALGLRDGPTIIGAADPDRAVLRGRAIARVDGQPVSMGGSDSYADVGRAETLIEAGFARGTVRLTFREGPDATLGATPGCRSRFQIVKGGLGRTQSDGRYVQLSEDMLTFATSDDELAAVLAHELAHSILGHRAKRTPSKQAEYEADWLSVWLVARAGYDLDAIVPFWTRLGKRTDYGIFSDGSHPGWKPRTAKLAEAVALVRDQRARGADLVPPVQQQSASQGKNPR